MKIIQYYSIVSLEGTPGPRGPRGRAVPRGRGVVEFLGNRRLRGAAGRVVELRGTQAGRVVEFRGAAGRVVQLRGARGRVVEFRGARGRVVGAWYLCEN